MSSLEKIFLPDHNYYVLGAHGPSALKGDAHCLSPCPHVSEDANWSCCEHLDRFCFILCGFFIFNLLKGEEWRGAVTSCSDAAEPARVGCHEGVHQRQARTSSALVHSAHVSGYFPPSCQAVMFPGPSDLLGKWRVWLFQLCLRGRRHGNRAAGERLARHAPFYGINAVISQAPPNRRRLPYAPAVRCVPGVGAAEEERGVLPRHRCCCSSLRIMRLDQPRLLVPSLPGRAAGVGTPVPFALNLETTSR